jgi:hypothetical protein
MSSLCILAKYLEYQPHAQTMLVRALQKPTNQNNQHNQNNQNIQNNQNHAFRINVEFAFSGIVVTNLLIDTTDKHGYQAVRRQIADCWSSTPGFETSLVAQNKMLVFVNHNGWQLHQRNFSNIKPGDTLVVTADLVDDMVDKLHQQYSKQPIRLNEQLLQAMQAVTSQNRHNMGLKVFKQQSKLLSCVAKLVTVAAIPQDYLLNLLGVFCKFDRQIMLQHTGVLTNILDCELLNDHQKQNDPLLQVIYLCCKTLHKLNVQDGEPGWQSIVDEVAKFHQKCKALTHKRYCHTKIWAGKLAKQYTNQPILPNGPAKRKIVRYWRA